MYTEIAKPKHSNVNQFTFYTENGMFDQQSTKLWVRIRYCLVDLDSEMVYEL